MSRNVALVLAGCGYLDGSEVQEAVLSLYFLDRHGANVSCFAPDRPQMHVVDHLHREPTSESRNVLRESARIARSEVAPLATADMADFDALVIPGGFGVAKNLSNFASQGTAGKLDPEFSRLVGQALVQHKPIVAICISPAIVAIAAKQHGIRAKLTIGHHVETAQAIEALGCQHEACPVNASVVDEENRIISTPAYMLGPGPASVGAGIEAAINLLMSWLDSSHR